MFDRDYAEAFANILQQRDLTTVLWDVEFMSDDDVKICERIEKYIKSAHLVVALWSKNSQYSAWVHHEAAIASKNGKLITVSLDGTKSPIELGGVVEHIANLSGWSAGSHNQQVDDCCEAIERSVRWLTNTSSLPVFGAFVSYNHEADLDFAPVLQSNIQGFGSKWYQRKARGLFRDKTNLTKNDLASYHALRRSLLKGLQNAKYFILLASPGSAKSPWVQFEVGTWFAKFPNARARFLIVLTDGEIEWNKANDDFDWVRTTALPDVLSHKVKEPLYVDVRDLKSEKN